MASIDSAARINDVAAIADTPQAETAARIDDAQPAARRGISRILAHGSAALRHRNYRLFFTGQLVSLIGTWMQNVGQSLLVFHLTGSIIALGTISTVQFMPVVIFSLFGGVLADRWPKRTLLLVTQTISMLLAFVLTFLVLSNRIELWHIYVLAALLGTTNAIDMPSRQSFVSEMVAPTDLANAIALNSAIFNMARFVGPVIAGVAIDLTGYGTAFLINGLSYIAAITALARMQPRNFFMPPARPKTPPLQNLKDGLVYIAHTPAIYSVIVVVLIIGTFGFNLNIWAPVLAKTILKMSDSGYGLLMGAFGLGSLIAALSVAFFGKKPSLRRILIAVAVFAVFLVGVGLSTNEYLTMLLLVGAGAAVITALVTANTTVQILAPPHMRGRVMSVYFLVFAGTVPLGSPFASISAEHIGLPASIVLGAGLSALAIPIALLLLRGNPPHSAQIAPR